MKHRWEKINPPAGFFNLCFICVHLWLIYSDEVVVAFAHQLSRRDLAVEKKVSTTFASLRLSADWNFFSSPIKASTERERFLRLASEMSRHISGEPEAMRV